MGRIYQISSEKGNIKWEEALQFFLYWKQGQNLCQETLGDYRKHVSRLFTRYPDAWQQEQLRQYVMEYMGEKIKPATYNLRLNYLGAFFKWCVEEGYMLGNPLHDFKRRKAAGRVVVIPEEILQQLLELPDLKTFAGLRDYALMLLTMDTGIRPKEAFSLMIEHLDLAHRTVRITPEFDKTRRGRVLPTSPVTAEVIQKLIRVRPPEWNDQVPVFCTYEGNPFSRDAWNDRMEMYSKKLGHKIRPYDLRHNFAVMYLRGGGHAFGLQQMLGHSDLQMTKVYVHLVDADLRSLHDTASPLNKLVPKKSGRLKKL